MKRLNDRQLLLYGPPILYVVVSVFFNLSAFFDEDYILSRFVLYGILTIYISWFVARWLVLQAEKRHPALDQIRRRVIYLSVSTLPALAVVMAVRIALTRFWVARDNWREVVASTDWLYGIGINLFYFVIIFSIYEARYFFRQWLAEKRASEELRRANLEIRLSSLKEQVQPHFLFNSLNTLQALVKMNENQRAVQFIGNLSQVYRYLLQNNTDQLITLEKELEFTHAYFNLLKTRFDDGLQLDVHINPAFRSYRLPPLTLQLLVENAVKHNIASASRPLRIAISGNGTAAITIRNNLQRKARNGIASNKQGLLNIAAKYRLLNGPEIEITETDSTFEVTVPLIDP